MKTGCGGDHAVDVSLSRVQRPPLRRERRQSNSVLFDDNVAEQYWATLEGISLAESNRELWNGHPDAGVDQARALRRWAELSFWFQPLSGPIGSRVAEFLGAANCAVEAIGGADVFGFGSHTFATSKPIHEVLTMYDRIVALSAIEENRMPSRHVISDRTAVAVASILSLPAIGFLLAVLGSQIMDGVASRTAWSVGLFTFGGVGGGALAVLAAPVLVIYTLKVRHRVSPVARRYLYVLSAVSLAPPVFVAIYVFALGNLQ